MKRVLIGALIFVVYLACVIAGALYGLHFSGGKLALFCVVLGVLGGATIAIVVWYMSRIGGESAQSGGSDSINLDALLRDANRKLRTSRLGVKSLAAAQIIYIVGEDNSAKTQTVLQSGLDVELLAGNLFRDGVVAPTQLANIWLAGSSVIVEAGGSLLQQPALWLRLIRATRPGKLGSLFAKGSRQAPRAVVVCVSAERIPGPSEAGYNANQIRSSAQALNERLRQLSQTLGISVPVYVLFTKLDTLPHFADYVARLSADEVKPPLGTLLAQVEAGTGLFAERASMVVSSRLDELTYALSEFRLEALSRGGDLKMLASGYEFPRDLQKRRATIVDFLVELTRPSQLGINPFLRGFFFSGMRAVVVEEAAAAPAQQQPSIPLDAGATSVFSIGGGPKQQPLPQPARMGLRKVPQWAFLPYLFSKLLLNDKSALEASRSSTKVNLLKRTLLACLCGCIFIYLVLLTVSFHYNRDLAVRVAAASAVPNDLQNLDQLGTLLLQLDSYRKTGPPQMYRWGLYSGDALYPNACNAYSTRFRALLLGPTQANIRAQLRALQSPLPGADYNTTYIPLKAYLITTSNPDQSAKNPGFLAPALAAAWTGAADAARLARTQFETYASILADRDSCMASPSEPDRATVDYAREYLGHFGGAPHIYLNMLANANSKNSAVHFNDNPNYPNSDHYILDPYQVPGAFTKPGYAFMQNAIQHPETYYRADEWVLGPNAGPSVDPATLSSQIQKLYIADYITYWRDYLRTARFVGFQSWNDAAAKLEVLGSNASPILELFSLISINTGVGQTDIMNAFQAPQFVVPPTNPPDRFTSPANQPYLTGLQGLQLAVKAFSANALNINDPAAAVPVQQAALAAKQAADNLHNSFNYDHDGNMDTVSFYRLKDPIDAALARATTAPTDVLNGGGKAFCSQAGPILAKFPFNPKSTAEATPEEAAQVFSPGQGYLSQLSTTLNKFLRQEGNRYITNPTSGVTITQGFLNFYSAAEQVSAALFPAGGMQPTLSFSLTEPPKSAGSPDAVLNIDGQQVGPGQTTSFRWISQPSSRITLTTPETPATPVTGSWSVFRLAFSSTHPAPNLEFSFGFQIGGRTNQSVHFTADGPGEPLLNPTFMNQLHCVATVAKQ